MAATPSLRVVKTMPYRGATVTWSNRYHFNGGTPADASHWTTFSDNVVTAEKAILPSNVTIVETVGYAAGSEVPVFSKVYSTAGTGAFATGTLMPGDVAAFVRYSTTARSTKNHPVYLANYYHGVLDATGLADTLNVAQKSAIQTYAASWISGFSDGTTTYNRAGPNGATATGVTVNPLLTHRDFPR